MKFLFSDADDFRYQFVAKVTKTYVQSEGKEVRDRHRDSDGKRPLDHAHR